MPEKSNSNAVPIQFMSTLVCDDNALTFITQREASVQQSECIMIYKIVMDDTQTDEVRFVISLPGINVADLHINLRLSDHQILKNINHKPASLTCQTVVKTIPFETMSLDDLQKKLVLVINYLVDQGYATYAGKYQKGMKTIPIFRGNVTDGLYVNSVDKKTGQKLLKGNYMKNAVKVRKLITWVIDKFPIVSEWAGVNRLLGVHDEKYLNAIVLQAAHNITTRLQIMPFAHEQSSNHLSRIVGGNSLA